jgi:hypothetical protein
MRYGSRCAASVPLQRHTLEGGEVQVGVRVAAHSMNVPLYRHTDSQDAGAKVRVCLYGGTLPKIHDDRHSRTCYRFNGLKPSNSQPNYLNTRGGAELVSPSSEGNMARVLDKPKQRRVGEVLPATFSSWFQERRRGLSPRYRALTHKMRASPWVFGLNSPFSYSSFNGLCAAPVAIPGHPRPRTSTHSCPYIYSNRDSTHLFTVRPPTLLRPHPPVSGCLTRGTCRNLDAPLVRNDIDTVLSPTFLPFFQSLSYRSSNHGLTVPLPTKETGTTVLSPTKSSVNRLNFHQSFSRKDVFKRCIKKTSGLMRLFFILVFFSSEWRASN